jgi:hypothetical protein
MAQVQKTETFGVSASELWSTVRDFAGIGNIMKGIEVTTKGEGPGAERTIAMQGGAEIVERLETLDDDEMRLQYSIIGGPLPLSDYLSTMQVREAGAGSELDRSGTFEPAGVSEEQAVSMVDGIYTSGIKGYKKALEG